VCNFCVEGGGGYLCVRCEFLLRFCGAVFISRSVNRRIRKHTGLKPPVMASILEEAEQKGFRLSLSKSPSPSSAGDERDLIIHNVDSRGSPG